MKNQYQNNLSADIIAENASEVQGAGSEITYIDVENLLPHPKNPRLEVGDVSELADSIKKKGVLQNLTVVPFGGVGDGRYTVIIGHRRLAAAKLAKLKKLPCAIVDMDEKEQVETMLIENMQRRQLTPYEEAEGFQLMFDFGGDIHTVAERTGFSETTVRNRMKLLRLDKEAFKKSQGKNISLNDYLAVAELEDEAARKEVLEKAGTNDFTWILRYAKDEEKKKVNRAALIEQLETVAERVDVEADDYDEGYWVVHHCRRFWDFIKPIEFDPDEYDDGAEYFFDDSHNTIDLYRVAEDEESENEPTPEEIEAARKEKERAERYNGLIDIRERAYALRQEFVKNFHPKSETEYLAIAKFAVQTIDESNWNLCVKICDLLDIEVKDGEEAADAVAREVYNVGRTYRMLFISTWLKCDDVYVSTHTYSCEYKKSEKLRNVYSCLVHLGYEMSDEEMAYLNGTHELFVKPDEDDAEGEE